MIMISLSDLESVRGKMAIELVARVPEVYKGQIPVLVSPYLWLLLLLLRCVCSTVNDHVSNDLILFRF